MRPTFSLVHVFSWDWLRKCGVKMAYCHPTVIFRDSLQIITKLFIHVYPMCIPCYPYYRGITPPSSWGKQHRPATERHLTTTADAARGRVKTVVTCTKGINIAKPWKHLVGWFTVLKHGDVHGYVSLPEGIPYIYNHVYIYIYVYIYIVL